MLRNEPNRQGYRLTSRQRIQQFYRLIPFCQGISLRSKTFQRHIVYGEAVCILYRQCNLDSFVLIVRALIRSQRNFQAILLDFLRKRRRHNARQTRQYDYQHQYNVQKTCTDILLHTLSSLGIQSDSTPNFSALHSIATLLIKQWDLHEMYRMLREMHPEQIDTILFAHYDVYCRSILGGGSH